MMLQKLEISDYVKLAACVVAVGIVQTVWPYVFPPKKGREPPWHRSTGRGAASDDTSHRHGGRDSDGDDGPRNDSGTLDS